MRLIDADKFKKELSSVWLWLIERYKSGYRATHGECIEKIYDILINQKTAYDVEKVVELLDKQSFIERDITDDDVVELDKAIEIVKSGGIDNK